MKSLEHIIREIREGKAEKGGKKSLEGSIRKVMKGESESSFGAKDGKPVEEAVGSIGTDDYQGNQFKSVRTATPHIKPPAGPDGHSQAPENASRQRTLAKEKGSMTMHGKVTEEEHIDEIAPAIAALAPYAGPAIATGAAAAAGMAGYYGSKLLKKMTGSSSYDPEAAKQNDSFKTSAERMKIMKSVSAPVIDKPIEVSTEPEKKKKEEPTTAPPTKVAEPSAPTPKAAEITKELPKTKPTELPAPMAVPAKPAAATQTAVAPATATAVDTGAQSKTDVAPATQTAAATKAATDTATDTKDNEKKKFSFTGISGVGHNSAYDAMHGVPVKTKVHKAMKHRMHEDTKSREEIENMPRKGDRKSIEYVGRKDSDPKSIKQKTSRLATIKNVIDEAKKQIAAKKQSSFESGNTKVFDYGKDILLINPDQRRVDLDVDSGEKIPKD
jgi:hypothetical protein